jgi:hypothetical protein
MPGAPVNRVSTRPACRPSGIRSNVPRSRLDVHTACSRAADPQSHRSARRSSRGTAAPQPPKPEQPGRTAPQLPQRQQ